MTKHLPPVDRPNSGRGQFLVYEAEDGRVKIDVRLEEETVWLTQQLMADLFQTTKQNIRRGGDVRETFRFFPRRVDQA